MANRKPQLYCTTRGMRLELEPGALPRSRDYKRFHLLISEPEPVLDMGKMWAAPEGNGAHFAPACMLHPIKGSLTGQARVLSGTCSPHRSLTLTSLNVPPLPSPPRVPGLPRPTHTALPISLLQKGSRHQTPPTGKLRSSVLSMCAALSLLCCRYE